MWGAGVGGEGVGGGIGGEDDEEWAAGAVEIGVAEDGLGADAAAEEEEVVGELAAPEWEAEGAAAGDCDEAV
ncbi:hypothetical protein PR202_gb24056 [Eleusine coracana subsp. coracana]|uniref:Uncharacterized protein n=1 Tax=Eleusine coracana subsp. coracana TaxID=191504 RepID=A0AAV5FKI8_ELECO|nr:hypothetical protein PR202_gb24056 [Eleusine coracana subsp. coracana]